MDHWWKGGWVGVGLGLGKEDQDSKKIKRMRKTLHHRRVGTGQCCQSRLGKEDQDSDRLSSSALICTRLLLLLRYNRDTR